MDGLETRKQAEQTLPALSWSSRATIPAVRGVNGAERKAEDSALSYAPGDTVGDYTLTKLLCRGAQSVLFLAENRHQNRTVIKLYEPGAAKTTLALRKLSDILRRRGCDSLMPLLSYGDLEGGVHYEVMPVYQQGTLADERFTEEELIRDILPQLNEALRFLGENHLVHNDIKPANIFWKDRARRTIVLGDYDCLTTDKQERSGGTLLYMAPERIFTDGQMHTNASDYCSLGLTLVSFLCGKALLEEESGPAAGESDQLRQFLYRRWQRQVSCPESLPVSPKTRDLLDRLLQRVPETRYTGEFIDSWIKHKGLGVGSYHQKTVRKSIKGLRYQSRLIMDIPELISVLGSEWEFGTFMLAQHRLDDFVRQFDGSFYDDCQQYASLKDTSEGLFKLMQSIAPSHDFYWLGTHYESMEDFVEQTERQERYGILDPFCHFCRAGLLSFYEEKNGSKEEQIERAREIEESGRRSPELAAKQLRISLSRNPDYVFHGVTLTSLEDLLAFLEENDAQLDEYVRELYESKAARVWLDYINQGSFLQEIEKIMLNV